MIQLDTQLEDSTAFGATVKIDDLLLAIRHDCVAFFGMYLAEELTMEVPELHEDIWHELLRMLDSANLQKVGYTLRKLFAVPRDHAKSTIAKLAVILFLKYTDLKFALYVSKTNGHAKNAIRDILKWLSSDQESQVFGPMITLKSSETESLWIVKIAIRSRYGDAPRYKTCIFKALGADQQVRGLNIYNTRPQIVIIDDIEDSDNTTTELQPKLDEWFMGPLLKSFDTSRNVCIFIGNMIRKTTLLARLSKEPEWNPTVFGCLIRDKQTGALRSLWPERHPLDKLLKEYAFFRRMGTGHIWEAEMMNLTQDEILSKDFDKAVRPPIPSPDDVTAGFICLDPAFGQKSWNDDSALTVHVRINGLGIPLLAESWVGKATEEELFDRMVEFSMKWGIGTWCIEAEASQKVLKTLFQLFLKDRKMNESLFTIIPLLSGGNSKASRIIAFRNSAGGGSYAVADSEIDLMDRLARYDPQSKSHDDLCDSAAYGPQAWALHGTVIESMGRQQIAMLAFTRNTNESNEDQYFQGEHIVAAF